MHLLVLLFLPAILVTAASSASTILDTSLEVRLAEFERLLGIVYINHRAPGSRRTEDAEAAIEVLRSDQEVLEAFTNFALFDKCLSWFVEYLIRLSSPPYDNAIQIMLQCPNLDISNVSASKLRLADEWLPPVTKERFWNQLIPTERLYREMIDFSYWREPVQCRVFCNLLSRGYHAVASLEWVNLLNYEAGKYYLKVDEKMDLFNTISQLLLSDFTLFDRKMAIVESQAFDAARRFMQPIYKGFMLLLATGQFYEQTGIPAELLRQIVEQLLAIEVPFEKPLTMCEHAALVAIEDFTKK